MCDSCVRQGELLQDEQVEMDRLKSLLCLGGVVMGPHLGQRE